VGLGVVDGLCIFGLDCKVYMVKVSYNQKPYRRALMEAFGATCIASPSDTTDVAARFWRKILRPTAHWEWRFQRPSKWRERSNTKYALAAYSISSAAPDGDRLEAIEQMALAMTIRRGDCLRRRRSNFAASRCLCRAQDQGPEQGAHCGRGTGGLSTLTKGHFAYDFGDTSHLTPLLKMHTLVGLYASEFMPAAALSRHGPAGFPCA